MPAYYRTYCRVPKERPKEAGCHPIGNRERGFLLAPQPWLVNKALGLGGKWNGRVMGHHKISEFGRVGGVQVHSRSKEVAREPWSTRLLTTDAGQLSKGTEPWMEWVA